jgi:hypothetical protein
MFVVPPGPASVRLLAGLILRSRHRAALWIQHLRSGRHDGPLSYRMLHAVSHQAPESVAGDRLRRREGAP